MAGRLIAVSSSSEKALHNFPASTSVLATFVLFASALPGTVYASGKHGGDAVEVVWVTELLVSLAFFSLAISAWLPLVKLTSKRLGANIGNFSMEGISAVLPLAGLVTVTFLLPSSLVESGKFTASLVSVVWILVTSFSEVKAANVGSSSVTSSVELGLLFQFRWLSMLFSTLSSRLILVSSSDIFMASLIMWTLASSV